jgi:hypothetical protein
LRAQVLDLGSVMFGMCKEYALAGHTQRVLALCVGAGNLLFSGGLDAQVRVWDLSSMACVQTIADHEHAVTGVALADDGKRPAAESKGKFLCTCSYDTTVRVFRPVPRASAEGARLSSASSAVSTDAPSSRGATPSGRPRSRSPAASTSGKGERASPFAPSACDWWVPHRVLRGSAVYVHAIATRGKHIWSAGEDGLLKQWCAARARAPVRARRVAYEEGAPLRGGLQGRGRELYPIVGRRTVEPGRARTLTAAGRGGRSVDRKHSIGQLEGCGAMAYALCLRDAGDDAPPDVEHSPTPGIRTFEHKLGSAGAHLKRTSQKIANTTRLFGARLPATEAQQRQLAVGARSPKLALPLLLSAGTDSLVRAWDLVNPLLLEDGRAAKADACVLELSPGAALAQAGREVEALRAQARLAVTPEGRALLQETLREEEARLAEMAREAERHTYVRGLAHDRGLVYSCGGEGGLRVWSLAYEKCVGEVTAPPPVLTGHASSLLPY